MHSDRMLVDPFGEPACERSFSETKWVLAHMSAHSEAFIHTEIMTRFDYTFDTELTALQLYLHDYGSRFACASPWRKKS